MTCIKGSATVLSCKDKVGIFQEEVSEDDKFAHEGGEGEFFGFAVGEEAKVEGFENRVVARGDQGGHVKNRADLGAAASNMALAAMLAAVTIEGSDSCQCRRLRIGQGAEFGHEGDQGSGSEGADALDLLEPLNLCGEVGGLGKLVRHERLQLLHLLAQKGNGSGYEGEQFFVGESFRQIIVLSDLHEQMRAVFDEGGKFLLEGVWKGERFRVEGLGKINEELGVQLVGLGQATFGFGKVADLPGVEAGNGTLGGVRQGDEQRLVTPASFADQDGGWREGFEPAPDGLFRVGNLAGLLVLTKVEVEFGDVDSDMDFHGGYVYSSTCDTNSSGSRNCSSWKHAPERIELTRELIGSSPERSHRRRLFPGGWPASRKNRQADSPQLTGQVQDTSPAFILLT